MQLTTQARFQGCLLGLAVGDAVGTTLEFQPRGSFAPLTDMVGGGPFKLLPGQWTDDTSMALCLATSLAACQGFDAHDQMERYCRWWQQGYLSSTGVCFDMGLTTQAALRQYQRDGNPYAGSPNPRAAGNGCIMRLAPIPMYFYPNLNRVAHFAAESSRTTHGAAECLDACRLFGRIVCRALRGQPKLQVLCGDAKMALQSASLAAIAQGHYQTKTAEEIQGSGYVVQSLEAALWAFARTSNYAEAVLMAANLGRDADTTAAICGQVAGAHYGVTGIPAPWRERLALRAEITQLADQLYAKPTWLTAVRTRLFGR